MKFSSLMDVILSAHVSEKAMKASSDNENSCYVFKVARAANKHDIKKAVELLFKTKVQAVRVVNTKGQSRRFGSIVGHTKAFRKAYVSLAKGQQIDFGNFQVTGN